MCVGRQPNRVGDALDFEIFVHLGIGEGRITSEVKTLDGPLVAGNHRLQHRPPVGGAVYVTQPQAQRSTLPNWLNTNSG
jgi:hypothetical protein